MKRNYELVRKAASLCAGIIVLHLGSVWASVSEAENLSKAQRGQGLIAVQPWVQLMGAGELGVGWMTSAGADGLVEWTQEPDGAEAKWKQAWYVEDGLRQANGTSQRAVIEGYDPAKPIRLRAVSRAITSFMPYKVTFGEAETSELRQLPAMVRSEGEASFTVFNDVHSRIANYPLLFNKVGKPGDFVVLNGDVLQDPQSEGDLVDNLLTPMSWFAAQSVPCFFMRGNHETRGAFARSMKGYLCMPENRYYAAMTFGAMRVVFIDCGEDKPDTSKEYSGLVEFDRYMERQLRWLKEEISSDEFKAARWRIVVVHIPPMWTKEESRLWHAERRLRESFAPVFDEGCVTAVISGHTHRPEMIEPCPDKERGFQWPVFIGGGPQMEKATAIRVEADNDSLEIKGYRSDGSVFAEKAWK